MRIPNYLGCSPTTGLWHFRLRVPLHLQSVLGCKLIKRTLRTKDVLKARLRALILAEGYSRFFDLLLDHRVEHISREDADRMVFRMTSPANIFDPQSFFNPTVFPTAPAVESKVVKLEERPKLIEYFINDDPPSVPPGVESMKLGKAQVAWLATLKNSCLPKTYTIKKSAIVSLVDFLGEKTPVHTITRSDLARWYQRMREKGASTPTLTNKQSYIGGKGGFFDWAIASGYYPMGDNPASSHVSYSVREKRARRKLGFRSYELEQTRAIFSPQALAKLPTAARWAALIGLYTGARASEVGQLLVSDFFVDDGLPCIRISDEGEHQKVKTEASLRTLPLHPHLISLGLLDWVEMQQQRGRARLFHATKADATNGAGNWITKAFGRHLSLVGKDWPAAKRGFHSLRKTFIQFMQGAGVVSELRAQIVGHDLDDEHHATYSRDFTNREKLNGLGPHSPGMQVVDYGIDLPAIRQLVWEDGKRSTPSAP